MPAPAKARRKQEQEDGVRANVVRQSQRHLDLVLMLLPRPPHPHALTSNTFLDYMLHKMPSSSLPALMKDCKPSSAKEVFPHDEPWIGWRPRTQILDSESAGCYCLVRCLAYYSINLAAHISVILFCMLITSTSIGLLQLQNGSLGRNSFAS